MKRIFASLIEWFAAPLKSHVTAGTLEAAWSGKRRSRRRRSRFRMLYLLIMKDPWGKRFI